MNRLDHPFTKDQFVRLEKIAAARNPVSRSLPWEDWKHGSPDNQGSLPISYNLEGYLLVPIRVGKPIRVLRTGRNGVKALGYFCSTTVIEIKEDNIVETSNSVYRVTCNHKPEEEAK